MNQNIVQRQLGDEAIAFVRESLEDGNLLAKLMLEHFPFTDARPFTYLPAELPDEQISQFQSGLKLRRDPADTIYRTGTRIEPVPNTRPWLCEAIQGFLRQSPSHICVFEDATRYPADLSVSNLSSRKIIFDGELYHALAAADESGAELINYTIGKAETWRFLGVMTTAGPRMALPEIGEGLLVDEADLLELARNAETIVVGAYDGESYIVLTLG